MPPHKDRYKHLAPKRPRECYREDGVLKLRLSETDARERSRSWPGYHAYECSTCGWWHLGADKGGEDA